MIKIELTEKDALILASFHAEFRNDLADNPQCFALNLAVNNFFNEVVKKIATDKFEEACADIQVDVLLGRAPDNDKNKL